MSSVSYFPPAVKGAEIPKAGGRGVRVLRWVRNKYRRLRARRKAQAAWNVVTQRYPRFFAHWAWTAAIPQVW
jgi:RNA-directed DNA polymerase